MSIEKRVSKLEIRGRAVPGPACRVIEIWGAREDGTQYILEIRELDESGEWVTKPVTENPND